jgi:hypothetical protein
MKNRTIITYILFFVKSNSALGQHYDVENKVIVDKNLFTNSKCERTYYDYFYSVEGKYPESSKTILKNTKAFLSQRKTLIKGSGYINFNLGIACDGKLSRNLSVTQTNEKYGIANFEKHVIEDLYAFIKTMNKWKICVDDEKQPVNYIVFISFKIKDGEIINIIP